MATCLVRAFSTLDGLSTKAASLFADRAREAVESRGVFTVALSGGSTPGRVYELLGAGEFFPAGLWSRVEVFWGDERCVPPSDGMSNFRLAHDALLSRVKANVHRVPGELDPEEAARLYEGEIRSCFGTREGVPAFDLIILGVGADGHTASLFPGSSALGEKERLCLAVYDKEIPRVTFTLPLLNNAAHVLFLVAGEEKAEAVRHVLEEGNARGYPAGMVKPARGDVTWLLDKAASSGLRKPVCAG